MKKKNEEEIQLEYRKRLRKVFSNSKFLDSKFDRSIIGVTNNDEIIYNLTDAIFVLLEEELPEDMDIYQFQDSNDFEVSYDAAQSFVIVAAENLGEGCPILQMDIEQFIQ